VIAEVIFHSGIERGQKLLEIGTGTGYEAAVLAEMGVRVFSVEVDKHLARNANQLLVDLGYKVDKTERDERKIKEMQRGFYEKRRRFPLRGTIELYEGNGRLGMKKRSPYNGIILAASVPDIGYVDPMLCQLSVHGGRLVVPAGKHDDQTLHIVERERNRYRISVVEGVSFDFARLLAARG
jgi:protein-L-isoaspartate(D-aspartate) O-methyltransferase